MAGLLTQNYTKKSKCRKESLNLVNFLKQVFLKYVSPGSVKFLGHWSTNWVLE